MNRPRRWRCGDWPAGTPRWPWWTRAYSTAALADYHLAVRPWNGWVLAANLLQVILRQGLWDRPFTDAWVNGFSALEGADDDRFSPEAGEQETGAPADLVRRIAVAYASTNSCLSAGRQRPGASRTGGSRPCRGWPF